MLATCSALPIDTFNPFFSPIFSLFNQPPHSFSLSLPPHANPQPKPELLILFFLLSLSLSSGFRAQQWLLFFNSVPSPSFWLLSPYFSHLLQSIVMVINFFNFIFFSLSYDLFVFMVENVKCGSWYSFHSLSFSFLS